MFKFISMVVALSLVAGCTPRVKTTRISTTQAETAYYTTCRTGWWPFSSYDLHSCYRKAHDMCSGPYRLMGFDHSLPGELHSESEGFYENGMYYACETS